MSWLAAKHSRRANLEASAVLVPVHEAVQRLKVGSIIAT